MWIHLFHAKEARHYHCIGANHPSPRRQSRCGRRLLEGLGTPGEDIATGLHRRLGLVMVGRIPAFWACQAHQAPQLERELVWASTTVGYMKEEEGSVRVAECPKYTPRYNCQVFYDFNRFQSSLAFDRSTVASIENLSLVDGKLY